MQARERPRGRRREGGSAGSTPGRSSPITRTRCGACRRYQRSRGAARRPPPPFLRCPTGAAEGAARSLCRSRSFGALSALPSKRIIQYIRALEEEGCLDRIARGDYPCLTMTARGCEVFAGHAELRLSLPDLPETAHASAAAGAAAKKREKRSAKRKIAAGAAEEKPASISAVPVEDLEELLRKLRSKLARSRGVPAFRILSDEALSGLAEKQPLTVEESLRIKGIGPARAATVIPAFLEEIRNWRRREFDQV